MNRRKGFTLIELMIVILIVGILAAVLVPLMRSRVEKAKWTEGQTGAGTIATALRAYVAQYPPAPTGAITDPTLNGGLGLTQGDLYGKYFISTDYSLTSVQFTAGAVPELTYTIAVTARAGSGVSPRTVTLNHLGEWGNLP
ncbi:MAG: type IV pilin protein [Planctomycetota bacterium]|jgi:prepilin-type N-terminal cleavage/methylation domain-containing protein